MQPLTVDQLVEALKGGHLNAAILGAWQRATDAHTIALIALITAMVAVVLGIIANARLSDSE